MVETAAYPRRMKFSDNLIKTQGTREARPQINFANSAKATPESSRPSNAGPRQRWHGADQLGYYDVRLNDSWAKGAHLRRSAVSGDRRRKRGSSTIINGKPIGALSAPRMTT